MIGMMFVSNGGVLLSLLVLCYNIETTKTHVTMHIMLPLALWCQVCLNELHVLLYMYSN